MKKKLLSISLVGVLVLSTLTGCGSTGDELKDEINKMSKSQLREGYYNLYQNYEQLTQDYTDLETVLHGIQNEEAPSAAIGITGDGTGRYTFNSTDSKIIFPVTFMYPEAEQVAPNGSISIVKDVSVGVNSNWIYKLTGSALELENSSGISGTIKVSKINYNYSSDEIQNEVLAPWFEELPPSELKYTKIFINNTDYGVQAKTPTMIDSEDAYLTCGMVGFGNYAITYIFVYRGQQDPNKDEAILATVKSITIGGNSLLIGE